MDKGQKLQRAQEILGYEFNDPEFLWEALQAAGSGVFALSNGRRVTNEGNKPFAAVGDSFMSLYFKVHGRNTSRSTGQTTSNLNNATNNVRLSNLCDASGLTACINGNPGQQGQMPKSTKSTTLEAVLGAIATDAGMIGTLEDTLRVVGSTMVAIGVIQADEIGGVVMFNSTPSFPHL